MKRTDKPEGFFRHPFFNDYRTVFAAWLLAAVAAWLTHYLPGTFDGFTRLTAAYRHLSDLSPLYPPAGAAGLPYGPFFSLLMAPFALLPAWLGCLLWTIGLMIFLFFVIRLFPLTREQHTFIYWFCAYPLFAALSTPSFSVAATALLLGAFLCIEKEKEAGAAFFLVTGILVQPFCLAGLAFFFLSKHKWRFFWTTLLWVAVWSALVLLRADFAYWVEQYKGWFAGMIPTEPAGRTVSTGDASLTEIIRRIAVPARYIDLYILAGTSVLLLLPYLRTSQYKYPPFRQALAASVLLFAALFTLKSEPGIGVLALTGTALWYTSAPWNRSGIDRFWLGLAFLLAGLLPSALVPFDLRAEYVYPYGLSVWPCLLIWLKLSAEMSIRNYYGRHDYFR